MGPVTIKLVVAGAFAAGKTTLIRHLADHDMVGTEVPTSGAEASVKEATTVGMEFGRHVVGEGDDAVILALYGVPGQERFHFMWDIVAEGLDGLLLLVDGTDPATWDDARRVAAHILDRRAVPTLVGVGRTGGDAALLAEVEAGLGIDAMVVACDAVDRGSARTAVIDLLVAVLDTTVPAPTDDLVGLAR